MPSDPLVDTGFDGGLAVPSHIIPDTVKPIGRSVWNLADGSQVTTLSYFGYVTIGHLQPAPSVVISLNGDPLLGRHVTDRFRVTFDHGHVVLVDP
jgi:predicted aspartyl protease